MFWRLTFQGELKPLRRRTLQASVLAIWCTSFLKANGSMTRDIPRRVMGSPLESISKAIYPYGMFNADAGRFTVLGKHRDGFSTIYFQTTFFRDGDVAFEPCKTVEEAGERKVVLGIYRHCHGNITTLNSGSEALVHFTALKNFMGK